MIGLGTIINFAAVLVGGAAGMLFKQRIKENVQNTLMSTTGVCVLFLGIGGAMEKMLLIQNGTLMSSKTMMIVGSLAIGALLGELLGLEAGIEKFGVWLKHKTKNDSDSEFVDAFVTASLTICIGAMAVVGAIQDGIYGNYSILAAKAVLDLIIIMIMTASQGKGCIFSAIPIAFFQGSITLLARVLEPLLTSAALDNLSLVGSILIFCVGINLLWGKKIKVANLLPSLVIAVVWSFLA